MPNASKFDGLAKQYAQFRPSYPAEAFQELRASVSAEVLQCAPLLIDVGCGTGISTRDLQPAFGDAPGMRIVGLEPSDDMRSQAIQGTAAGCIEYRPGVAESLPFADRSAALVMAAQAAHWFDRERFYVEAARVLSPGGVLAILFNNRRQDDPFQDEYQQLLERISPGYQRSYRDTDFAAEMRATGLFAPTIEFHVDWQQRQTRDQFLGMSLSTTYIHKAIEASGQSNVEAEILVLWNHHLPDDGLLIVPYQTELIGARRN